MKGFLKPSENGRLKEKYLFVFLVSFGVMMAVFTPLLIYNKGYFFYYGDFNSQQLMFYDHVQKAAKSGTLNWDWGTDLGSSFIGAYSFYLLGSPFFWLTTLFPKGAAPYLIPWLLSLKTAVAALTAYAYIRRFVQSREASVIGAMLYAFSGFQLYNVFFNHFHDVTALFPLLLLALEMNVNDGRKGFFAVTVCLMAVVNYFFFTGQVTFLIIYFVCRCLSKNDFKITLKKFGLLALESVVGVMMAAFLLLPAVMGIIENPRVDRMLTGMDMAVYDDKFRIIRIIQSFFMMPDPPARSNLFTSDTAKWASIGGYLPMFSMAGVIAFMKARKGHWAKRLTAACIVCAFVPFLNTSFYMFNSSYYARWYYMPILIMALMTACVIEPQPETDNQPPAQLKKGVPLCVAAVLVFLAVGLLPTEVQEKYVFFKIAKYYDLFWIQIGVTAVLTGVLVWFAYFCKGKNRTKLLVWLTVGACVVCAASSVWYGASQGIYPEVYTRQAINGKEQVQLPQKDGEFYRIDTSENIDNFCMFWGYSSMRAFQSAVSPSIMEFYIDMGLTRDVASRIDTRFYQLRPLLSVKYYVKRKPLEDDFQPMPGFSLFKETKDFCIYENKNYLPMGLAYDSYITKEEYDSYSTGGKAAALLDSLVLTEEQYERYSDIIDKREQRTVNSISNFNKSIEERRSSCCYSFKPDTNGFSAEINLDEDRLVMFSVPYDKGWSAAVNGKEVRVEKVASGLTAIKVPAGQGTKIRFDYHVVGLKEGIIISLAGVAILAVYLITDRSISKKKAAKAAENDNKGSETDVSE